MSSIVLGVAAVPAAVSQQGAYLPADQGLLGWTYDPAMAIGFIAPVAGVLHLQGIQVRAATTSLGAVMTQVAAGTLLTAGQNFLGLYTSGGVLVAQSADLSATWTILNQLVNVSWVSPALVVPGQYWVGILANSTGVLPTFRSAMTGQSTSYSLGLNAGLTPANYRFAAQGSGLTALPSSFTPATNVGNSNAQAWQIFLR